MSIPLRAPALFSFALHPEDPQPSGSANFSRLDSCAIRLVCSGEVLEAPRASTRRLHCLDLQRGGVLEEAIPSLLDDSWKVCERIT